MLSFVRAAAALAAAAIVSGAAAQAPLPRNIKIVVPFSAVGSNDVIARAIAVCPLGARLGIPVVVENKAGAAGVIGSDSVAKSPRDGSVLLLAFVELPHRRGHAEGAAVRSADGVRCRSRWWGAVR